MRFSTEKSWRCGSGDPKSSRRFGGCDSASPGFCRRNTISMTVHPDSKSAPSVCQNPKAVLQTERDASTSSRLQSRFGVLTDGRRRLGSGWTAAVASHFCDFRRRTTHIQPLSGGSRCFYCTNAPLLYWIAPRSGGRSNPQVWYLASPVPARQNRNAPVLFRGLFSSFPYWIGAGSGARRGAYGAARARGTRWGGARVKKR